jgi:hypothetical protein
VIEPGEQLQLLGHRAQVRRERCRTLLNAVAAIGVSLGARS